MKSAEGDNDTSVLKFVFEIHLIKNFVGERVMETWVVAGFNFSVCWADLKDIFYFRDLLKLEQVGVLHDKIYKLLIG